MIENLLTIVTKPPYGCEDAYAGLRYALSQIAAGSLELSDTLLMEDGVYNAVKGQKNKGIGMPSNGEAVSDLLDLDGGVFVVKEDIEERGISKDILFDGVQFVSRKKLAELVDKYDVFSSF